MIQYVHKTSVRFKIGKKAGFRDLAFLIYVILYLGNNVIKPRILLIFIFNFRCNQTLSLKTIQDPQHPSPSKHSPAGLFLLLQNYFFLKHLGT